MITVVGAYGESFYTPESERDAMMGFYRSHGSYTKKFECPKCLRRYTQKKHLFEHIRYACGKPPSFACPYCNSRRTFRYSMYEHIRRRHPTAEVTAVQLFTEQTE